MKSDLENRGHDVWFDLERLRQGHDWELYIEEGLRWCDKVVLLMTPYSVRRRNPRDPNSQDGYCLNEIAKAIERNKLIIPILLVELDDGPPVSICRIQYLDLRDAIPIVQHEEQYRNRFDRLVRAIEQEDLDFEGGQARLNRLLRPLNFDAQLAHHIARFTGREWLFTEMDDWLNHRPESRVFWIIGGPGIGKSAIAAQLCHRRADVIASHFCVYGHDDKSDPSRAVLSLAYQIASHLPEFARNLQNLQLEQEQAKNPKTLFDNLIVSPLSDIPEPSGHRLVVIDAIDEATHGEQNEVADLVAENWSQTPNWLRLVITSRPESAVIDRLKRPELQPFLLDARSKENLADLKQYLISGLANLDLEPDKRAVGTILDKSEGMFLYVNTILDELFHKNLTLKNVDDFPEGMSGHYRNFFARQFPNTADYEECYASVLSSIVAQREPLPIELLALATGLREFDLRKRLQLLSALFPLKMTQTRSGAVATISPFHKTIGDWLTAQDATGGYLAGQYAIDVSLGEDQLANACWCEYERDVCSMSDYTLAHLPMHLMLAQRWDDMEKILTDLSFCEMRCSAAMTSNLQRDFAVARNQLPELARKRSEQEIETQRSVAYERNLLEYARKCSSHGGHHSSTTAASSIPLPPDTSVTISMLQNEEVARLRMNRSQTRADRLKAVAMFISTNSHRLAQAPNEVIPLAFNQACRGMVAEQAELLSAKMQRVWIARAPRPKDPPERQSCIRVLQGHSDTVSSVALVDGGRRIVSASLDRTIRLWSVDSGEQDCVLTGHKESVLCIDATLDGKRAVSASRDGTVRVWDLNRRVCERTLSGHQGWSLSVAMTPDGSIAVSGGADATVRLWDLDLGIEIGRFDGHSNWVDAVKISADGKRIVSADRDGAVFVWDRNDRNAPRIILHLHSPVYAIAILADGSKALLACYDGKARVVDLNSGVESCTLDGHAGPVYAAEMTPDGRMAATASIDRTTRIWDLATGQELRRLSGHDGGACAVAISVDGRSAFSGSVDRTLRIWDVSSIEILSDLGGHNGLVRCFALTPDRKSIISGSQDRTLRVWDVESGKEALVLKGHSSWVLSAVVTSEGQIVSGSGSGGIRVWDLDSGVEHRRLQGHTGPVYCLAYSRECNTLISASDDQTLRFWDLKLDNALLRLQSHSAMIRALTLSPDGLKAITGSRDRMVKVWDVRTGELLHSLSGHTNLVRQVASTPDGQVIVSGSDDGTLRTWDMASGTLIHCLDGHTDRVTSFAMANSGEFIVSASRDQTLRVWELQSGRMISILRGHHSTVQNVVLTPNGRFAVSSSSDGTLQVWYLASGESLATYFAESTVRTVSPICGDDRIVCGTVRGKVHFLNLRNLET